MYENAPNQIWPMPGQEVWITRYGGLPPTKAQATIVTGDVTIVVPVLPDGTLDTENKKAMRPSSNSSISPVRAFPDRLSAVKAWNEDIRRLMQAAVEEHEARMEMLSSRILPEPDGGQQKTDRR